MSPCLSCASSPQLTYVTVNVAERNACTCVYRSALISDRNIRKKKDSERFSRSRVRFPGLPSGLKTLGRESNRNLERDGINHPDVCPRQPLQRLLPLGGARLVARRRSREMLGVSIACKSVAYIRRRGETCDIGRANVAAAMPFVLRPRH